MFTSSFCTQSGFIAGEKPKPYRKLVFPPRGLSDSVLAGWLDTDMGLW